MTSRTDQTARRTILSVKPKPPSEVARALATPRYSMGSIYGLAVKAADMVSEKTE